jgi:aminoglycoside 3-N-acetyltransferase I
MTLRFEIRILSSQDVDLMRGLIGMFAKAFGDSQTYLGDPPSDAYLFSLLGKSHFIAIAATIHELVVGGLTAYQLDKFEQDRREICIYDLAVNEEYRRRGIATATIEALRVEAARRDAYVIFVQADLEDAPAIALYEKLGVKETAHHFDIALRSPTSRPRDD